MAEYSKIACNIVDNILDVWGGCWADIVNLVLERVGDNDKYSYLIDSGTTY